MILPVDKIQAALTRRGGPDVSAAVARAADWYANDWPPYQIARGLFALELQRVGLGYVAAHAAATAACHEVGL